MHLINFKPFHKTANRKEVLNEVSILICTETMLFYTLITEPQTQFDIGWFSIAVFCVALIINFVQMMLVTLERIKIRIKKYYMQV